MSFQLLPVLLSGKTCFEKQGAEHPQILWEQGLGEELWDNGCALHADGSSAVEAKEAESARRPLSSLWHSD